MMETVEQWFKRHGLNTQSEVMDRLESLEAQLAEREDVIRSLREENAALLQIIREGA